MSYLVVNGGDAREILRDLKKYDGRVIIPAAVLRALLHELQVRRKQMSKPQKK